MKKILNNRRIRHPYQYWFCKWKTWRSSELFVNFCISNFQRNSSHASRFASTFHIMDEKRENQCISLYSAQSLPVTQKTDGFFILLLSNFWHSLRASRFTFFSSSFWGKARDSSKREMLMKIFWNQAQLRCKLDFALFHWTSMYEELTMSWGGMEPKRKNLLWLNQHCIVRCCTKGSVKLSFGRIFERNAWKLCAKRQLIPWPLGVGCEPLTLKYDQQEMASLNASSSDSLSHWFIGFRLLS